MSIKTGTATWGLLIVATAAMGCANLLGGSIPVWLVLLPLYGPFALAIVSPFIILAVLITLALFLLIVLVAGGLLLAVGASVVILACLPFLMLLGI